MAIDVSAAFTVFSNSMALNGLDLFVCFSSRYECLFALFVSWVGAERLLHFGGNFIHVGGVGCGDSFLAATISPT